MHLNNKILFTVGCTWLVFFVITLTLSHFVSEYLTSTTAIRIYNTSYLLLGIIFSLVVIGLLSTLFKQT